MFYQPRSTEQRISRWRLGLIAVCLAVFAGCTSGDDTSDDVSDDSTTTPATGAPPNVGDDDPTDDGNDGAPETPAVRQLDLIASGVTLASAATGDDDGLTITAIARDANNNAVSGATVDFSSSAGRLIIDSPTTGANGTATATLFNAPDRANRTIRVTASVSGLSDTVSVPVTGTVITLDGPGSVAVGERALLQAQLLDSASAPIAGVPLEISPADRVTPADGTLDTDTQGQVAFTVGMTMPGATSINARALGTSADFELRAITQRLRFMGPNEPFTAGESVSFSVRVQDENGDPVIDAPVRLSASRGTLNDTTETEITLDTDGQGIVTSRLTARTAGQTTVIARNGDASASRRFDVVADEANQLVFSAMPIVLDTNAQSTLQAIVRDRFGNPVADIDVLFTLAENAGGNLTQARAITDADGVARTTYRAPATSTQNDIRLTARVDDNPNIADSQTLRVAGNAIAITLGRGGSAVLSSDGTTYTLPFAVLVTDAAGNPADDGGLQIRLRPVAYQAAGADTIDCPNEDRDNDGILDVGEDSNDNDRLDPGQVASVPGSPTLDESGAARFDVTYLSLYADRVRVELSATATVDGSEGSQSLMFELPGTASTDNPFTRTCVSDESG